MSAIQRGYDDPYQRGKVSSLPMHRDKTRQDRMPATDRPRYHEWMRRQKELYSQGSCV